MSTQQRVYRFGVDEHGTDVTEGAEGTGGESGKLVFTDQLGKYMKVTGTPTIVFAGKNMQPKVALKPKTMSPLIHLRGLSKETRFTAAQACPLLS